MPIDKIPDPVYLLAGCHWELGLRVKVSLPVIICICFFFVFLFVCFKLMSLLDIDMGV